MSIFSLGQSHPAQTVDANRRSWRAWNPARREPIVAPALPVDRDPWYRWNPYRGTPQQVGSQSRRDSYVKGVRDEQRVTERRQRRRSHPVFALVVFASAVAGIGFMGLAYEEGSFAAGGAVVDHKLGEWRADVSGAASRAGDQSGHAVRSVGQSISDQSQHLVKQGG